MPGDERVQARGRPAQNSPRPTSPQPTEGSGTGRWDRGQHSLDFVDLGAEVKYVHGAFQGMRDLVGCLLPGEAEDAEEGAALRGRERVGRRSRWARSSRLDQPRDPPRVGSEARLLTQISL